VTRLLEGRISKRSYSHSNQVWALLGLPENGSSAFWTETESYASTGVRRTGELFCDTLSRPDLLPWIPGLNTKGASGSALAFQAVAHRDPNGITLACEAELSATATSFAICHGRCLSITS
jgi:hypothetical protein